MDIRKGQTHCKVGTESHGSLRDSQVAGMILDNRLHIYVN